ncbi:hypothetical protein FRC00_010496 [Tulasnella sp. 408]|nr:hypothetical protein FRC00_010496 [Tulasnella sp. 408]
MNCQQHPKVGGQDFCSKACRDDASSRLPANAQNNASGPGFPWLSFAKRASRLTAKRSKTTNSHLMRVSFDPSTGDSIGLANEWELILQENDTVRQDKKKNPQVVTKTIELSQETARALGKTADKDMATSPTTGGTTGDNYDLGEGLRNTVCSSLPRLLLHPQFRVVVYGKFTPD